MIIGSNKEITLRAEDIISREEFLGMIIKALGIQVDLKSEHPYYITALKHKIITKETFGENYQKPLSKSDAAVVLVRADEYLYGKTVTDKQIEQIINFRISDIEKVTKARRSYIARCYQLGYLVGNSDGTYRKTRTFQPSQKISVSTAKLLVERLLDITKRERMSQDGQLIRTTNLPRYADKYEYILESFPNEYYDWDFYFMGLENHEGQKAYLTENFKEFAEWCYPKNIKQYCSSAKRNYFNINKNEIVYDKELYENCKEQWIKNVEKYLQLAFNVDYRTLKTDKKWFEEMKRVVIPDKTYVKKLNKYIDAAIKNKTIIECDKVAADVSGIYYYMGQYVVRCYVHYRINSALLIERSEDFISPILYGGHLGTAILENYKEGEWRDGYFDVEVSKFAENLGVEYCNFLDLLYVCTEE